VPEVAAIQKLSAEFSVNLKSHYVSIRVVEEAIMMKEE
jgi:hypothetical protein